MFYNARLASFRTKRRWHGNVPPADMARAGFVFAPNPDAPDNCRCFTCAVDISGWEAEDDPLDEHLRHSSDCEWARVLGTTDHTTGDRLVTFKNWPHPLKNFRPSPLALSQAGFFFNPTSKGDDTAECAYCGICLNHWEAEDTPLQEHQAASSECEYVLRCFETSSLVDSHLPESSLGVIPVLKPSTNSVPVLLPDQTLDQSVYGNLLEDTSVASVSHCKSGDQMSLDPDFGVAPASPVHASIASHDYTTYETAPGGETRSSNSENDLGAGMKPPNSNISTDKPVDSESEPPSESSAHDAGCRQNTTETLPEEAPTNDRPHSPESEADTSMSQQNMSILHSRDLNEDLDGDLEEDSMVTVDVEEVSVDSTTRSEVGLDDPETPSNSTPQSVPGSEQPVFSVFKSAFTSTPFNRMSPTKMMSTAPMPSPLAAPLSSRHEETQEMPSPLATLPIDLARTSFGIQQQDQSIQARMYPRLPSFPSMHTSAVSFGNDQDKEPFDHLAGIDRDQHDLEPFDTTATYHTAENDRSTPSPIRSPHKSSIIGSSPVLNSFDDLIEKLTTDPDNSKNYLVHPDQVPPLTHEFMEENQTSIQGDIVHLDSQLSNMDISGEEPDEIIMTAPNRKQLIDEFVHLLPESGSEYLLQAKSYTIKEWQALLSDEVERQILKVTEEAVEEAELQRKRLIKEIRAQYGH